MHAMKEIRVDENRAFFQKCSNWSNLPTTGLESDYSLLARYLWICSGVSVVYVKMCECTRSMYLIATHKTERRMNETYR